MIFHSFPPGMCTSLCRGILSVILYTKAVLFEKKKVCVKQTEKEEVCFYPLTPPWITPFSILPWKKGKKRMIGAMAAIMTANWIR